MYSLGRGSRNKWVGGWKRGAGGVGSCMHAGKVCEMEEVGMRGWYRRGSARCILADTLKGGGKGRWYRADKICGRVKGGEMMMVRCTVEDRRRRQREELGYVQRERGEWREVIYLAQLIWD